MKAIFCILIFVLSTIISPYHWYLIQIPAVSVVLFESVLSVVMFFNQSLNVVIFTNVSYEAFPVHFSIFFYH